MRCHSCGINMPAGVSVCPSCAGANATQPVVETTTAVDTTGLPAGAPAGAVGATSGVTRGVAATAWLTGGDTAAGTLDVGHLPSSVGPLAPGQTFGPRYHIIRLLGLGGMGAVYQARDEELNLAVA